MPRLHDLTGQRFGRLVVLERAERPPHIRSKSTYWLCKCDCGNTVSVVASSLVGGITHSCGCYNRDATTSRNTTHGLCHTPLYKVWYGMKERCYNEKNVGYGNYGGRGITVCEEWLSDFQIFYDWAMKNGYAPGLSIDRKDVNGNYEPGNCRWATRSEQNCNTRRNRWIEHNGESHILSEWAELKGLTVSAILHRLERGWDLSEALETPLKTR